MIFGDLINAALQFLPDWGVGAKRDTFEAEIQQRHDVRRALTDNGFVEWISTPPPYREVVEAVYESNTRNTFDVRPADMHSFTNVSGLWWRKRRSLIDVSPKQIGSSNASS